jgi:hypothetical protein
VRSTSKGGAQRWQIRDGVFIEFFEGFRPPYRVYVRGQGPSVAAFETFEEAVAASEYAELYPMAALP